MKIGGWQRLNAEYAKQSSIETPNWPPPDGSKVVNRGGSQNNVVELEQMGSEKPAAGCPLPSR
ncbi:MAG: hypothetical protein WB869_16990 [Candidatus Acidiferrales bacterium]